MTDILSGRGRPTLDRLARESLLVAFDYDGTLAPIVTRPEQARLRSTTHRLLQQVARRYPCAVISGRARADVAQRLHDVPLAHISGNHGLEPWAEKPQYAALVKTWVALLERVLGDCPGVLVEDKVYSVSIHYRVAQHKRLARRAIDNIEPHLRGARRINGKAVVNFLPRRAPGKGAALERTRRLMRCESALYVGDDDTDEEAFGAPATGRLVGVRVGPFKETRAKFVIRSQRDIDRLLKELVSLRPQKAATRRS